MEDFSYIREWLCLMACGKIIEVDDSGEKFWIREDRMNDLCGDKANVFLVIQQCVLMCAKAYPTVIELFRKDGPLGKLVCFVEGPYKNRFRSIKKSL